MTEKKVYITTLGEESSTAILYNNGNFCWTEDLNGKMIEKGQNERKVYFQTKAKGYDVHVNLFSLLNED